MSPVKPLRTDVFISSTYDDLIEYRAAVTEAILSLGLFPSGMENWPLRDENAIQLCQRKIEEAEVFVGIYAYRYGWTPDGYDGKSITELEYDWATERKIPRLRFIMADTQSWPEELKEKDAQPALNAFKSRLKRYVVGIFTTPDDLKVQVIAALVKYVPKTNLRALEPYLRWLHEECKRSGLLRVLNPRDATVDTKSITIDKVYTPLYFRRGTALTQMAYSKSKLVVLGDPGSGKSTFLQFLTVSLTGHLINPESDWMSELQEQGWEQGEYIPLRVTLRDFAQDIPAGTMTGGANLLFDHIERQLARPRLEACFPALQEALENGSALVLLDGLDEVPDERRDLIRQTIMDFIQRNHQSNRYIVTCRILSYTQEAWKLRDMDTQTIAPFEEEQIAHFVRAWYTTLAELREIDMATAERRTEELIAEMENEQVGKIAQNPMLLTVMAIVHNHQGALPKEIARLYQDCVELLMQKWRPTAATSLMSALAVRDVDLDQMLEQIAYDAHSKQAERQGAADIPEHEIVGIARARLGGDLHKAGIFCDYVEKQAGLLIGRGQSAAGWRVFSFPHRTFQEFLAGRWAANNDFPEIAPELAERGANWREALMLATGHLVFNQGQTTLALSAIDSLCPADDAPQTELDWQKVWLAGDMLKLIGLERAEATRKGPGLIRLVRQRLVELIEGSRLNPIERAAAGRTLSVLGDPRPGVGLRPDGLPDIIWADEIPAGFYWIGSDNQRDNNAHRQITIAIPFRVAKYLVTQAQYLAFQNDTSERGYACAEWWDGLAATDEEKLRAQPRFPYANHPMEQVNWYQATAFCRWLTWHVQQAELIAADEEICLPHETEWEVAAQGVEDRTYSYAGDFDLTKANMGETGIGQTSAVGLFPDGSSPCAALDMTGNVEEWCLNRVKDGSSVLGGADLRVMRGGSWLDNQNLTRAAFRYDFAPPHFRNYHVGFRVVRILSSHGL
ncbi:MAG: SUMF1/EgtB/PvdO family nonheme iron enzyme [Anaerolineae bacterium]|nr:SUMF1/EgtB/PvdO family nonheme iron enzyme [Anaerolineae bacterium]